jgi:hypothetical protein
MPIKYSQTLFIVNITELVALKAAFVLTSAATAVRAGNCFPCVRTGTSYMP